jgi:hypothetical protein
LKFEDKLESEIEIIPFEGLMVMKIVGFGDPELKAFSNEYDNVGLAIVAPEMHT